MAKKFYYVETDSIAVLALNTDLTGSSVRVVARPTGSAVPLPDLPVVIQPGTKGRLTIDIDGLTRGAYELQIEQNQGGVIAHYPNKGFDLLIIGEDLG
jgi:hypothetical protein